MTYDPTTSLPQLPADMRFYVQKRYVTSYIDLGSYQLGYEVVLQRSRTTIFGRTRWSNKVSEAVLDDDTVTAENPEGKVAQELTDENIRRAAEKALDRWNEQVRDWEMQKKYLGAYPPKSL